MKFALKSLDDLSCSNPSGVRNEISAFLLLPRIHIIRTVCLLKAKNRAHNNRIQTQSIWISTRFNVLEIPRMQLDISMETCFPVGSYSSWSPALSCHFLCYCSQVSIDQSFLRLLAVDQSSLSSLRYQAIID